MIALLLATLLSFWTLGLAQGFNRESILKFTNECLAPTASITLLVGAGGGLNRILVDAGVTDQIVSLAQVFHLSPLLMGWLFAALMRIATGSATVAMTTASGIVAPVAVGLGYPHPELLVLATGAGSVIFSHVNDGGFWLIKEYFNMTVTQTFKTWTVLETIDLGRRFRSDRWPFLPDLARRALTAQTLRSLAKFNAHGHPSGASLCAPVLGASGG